ncbi:MAG TPA: 5-formyltetrahydrofolate cyclo-ligase [Arenimonas sp.]|nr:5-formyltetrahydrofolate cyclo-ligase [Arenimonas sp.]
MRHDLRRDLKAKRAQLDAAEKMAAAEAVALRVIAHLPDTGGTLAGYWASAGELPLHILQMRLPANWIWCLPVVQAGRQLLFAPWRADDDLATNQYGIPEPTLEPSSCLRPDELNVALVPLLGFTRQGRRLGMGGGYYDASFAFRKSKPAPPMLIGVGFACQELDALDAQSWDIGMDAIATEREWLDCPAKEYG